MKFANVPYRKWDKHGRLMIDKRGERVFNLAMKEHQAGKAVDMHFSPPMHDGIDESGKKIKRQDRLYETISVTISD